MTDSPFEGFPGGRITATAIPNVFFTELLPAIDSLAELKVTLHVLWRLGLLRGTPRFLTVPELEADLTLARGIGDDVAASDGIRDGLAAAVKRGTLLQAHVSGASGDVAVILANTAEGRASMARLLETGAAVATPPPGVMTAARPSIFELYEQNIGLLTPLLADELTAAAHEFPPEWVTDAFRIAVTANRRNWRYIRAILDRWTSEGRDDGQKAGGRATETRVAGYKGWRPTYRPAR